MYTMYVWEVNIPLKYRIKPDMDVRDMGEYNVECIPRVGETVIIDDSDLEYTVVKVTHFLREKEKDCNFIHVDVTFEWDETN